MRRARERGAASRASKGLDLLSTPMLAIANQSVKVSFGVSKVGTISVGTGEARGVHAFGCSPPTFDLSPRTYRSIRRRSSRRGRGGQTTGGAVVWAARRCRRRGSLARTEAAVLDGAGPGWDQHRAHSRVREKMSKNTSRNTWKFMMNPLGLK